MNLCYVFEFMTLSTNVWAFYMFIVSTSVSLHSQASYVLIYNGLNFSSWCEQVQFHLGVLDLDLALLTYKPVVITNSSNTE